MKGIRLLLGADQFDAFGLALVTMLEQLRSLLNSEAHHAVANRHTGCCSVVVGIHAHGAGAKPVSGVSTGAADHRVAAVGGAIAVVRPGIGIGRG